MNIGQYINRNTLVKKIMTYEEKLKIVDITKYTKHELESKNSEELYRIFRMMDYWNSQMK